MPLVPTPDPENVKGAPVRAGRHVAAAAGTVTLGLAVALAILVSSPSLGALPAGPSGPAVGPSATTPADAGARELAGALRQALESHTRGGRWGVLVVSLTRGDTLFASNPDELLLPASTMKLYTAAMALERFGPDHVFRTSVFRDGPVSADGVIEGNVYVQGTGDPSLTRRFWRDQAPMDALARQIAASGVRRVRGDVVADASAFEDRMIPAGWEQRYLGAAYAAPFSALSLHENVMWVVVEPGVGLQATVRLDPPSSAEHVQNLVRQVPGRGGRISASRRGDGVIVVRGTIGAASRPLRYGVVVQNPPLFAAGALRAALINAGVAVDGPARVGATPSSGAYVAALGSPPLAQIVGEMNRESINVFAELLYRGSVYEPDFDRIGSAETALATLRAFLAEKAAAEPEWIEATDGSGLSTLDRVTARSLIHLLAYAHGAPWGPAFHASLPVKGESGTLRRRSAGPDARGNLHAKTGTTNRSATLAGYVSARNGEVLGFALLYNGNDRSNARAAMDRMGAAMAEFLR